jgi:putative ABC transport system substrate-binding protein
MRRRYFVGALASAAIWPRAVRAQDASRLQRVAVVWGGADEPLARSKIAVFEQALAQLGWVQGHNVQIDVRWGGHDSERLAAYAREVVQANPDVILAGPTNALVPVKRETQTIPIVFVQVSDPLGRGIVDSLARPSGNLTGFSNLEFSLVGKYLQLLKEIAPGARRVSMMIHVSNAVSADWFRMFGTVAPSFAIEPLTAPIQERSDIVKTVEGLEQGSNGGLILPGDSFVEAPEVRKFIVGLAAAHRLPALYTHSGFVRDGGLMAYAIDQFDQYRRAASYVDRVLRGESPSNLPVQQPSKFDLTINSKTAQALGLTIPMTLQASANEVID